MQTGDAPTLEYIQQTVFPDLIPEERMQTPHFAAHVHMFPEGQWVALVDGQLAGSASSIRYIFDPEHPHPHRFAELFDGGFMRTHNPEGNWLYGMDMAVLPEFRGMGIARLLYRARQQTVRALHLDGQVIVGMLNGYGAVAHEVSVYDYFQALQVGKQKDPTVSVQMHIGFRIVTLLEDYLTDPTCGNAGVLLILPAHIDV